MIFFTRLVASVFSAGDYSSTDYGPRYREGVKMFVAVLAAIFIFGVVIFVVLRLVKERSAETERAEEEEKKATPDPNEFH